MSISLCRDAGFIAQKPASLQGKVKVTKVTQILGDFAHFSMEFDHFYYELSKIIAILGGFAKQAYTETESGFQ
jgi:hypothetical protein